MLTFNLLPEGARKVTLSPIEQFHRTPLMWILFGGMVLFPLLLTAPLSFQHQRLQRLTARVNELEPKKVNIDQLRQYLQELHNQQAVFEQIVAGQDLWSRRLNILSDATPDGVWFTELTLDREKGLIIQGSAIGEGGTEMVHVGRLVSDLKAEPLFTAAVKDVQIESIKRVQLAEVELVQFTLACALQEAADEAATP